MSVGEHGLCGGESTLFPFKWLGLNLWRLHLMWAKFVVGSSYFAPRILVLTSPQN